MSSFTYKRLADLLPFLVDEEFGIISQIISLPRQADMPDFFYYKAVVANTGVFGGAENWPVAGGTALDRDRALVKAVGEAIERYSSGIYDWSELQAGTYQDLKPLAVHPDLFAAPSKDAYGQPGFPFRPFEEDSMLRWSKATRLASGEEVLVPASMVYCPYEPDPGIGEWNVAESISTGLAAHLSFEDATLNGILEVVERDSFMLFWLSGRAPKEIDPASLLTEHHEMLRRFSDYGYHIRLFDIQSDTCIPTVLGVMKGSLEGAVPFLVSAATHLVPSVAVKKCLEELALIERYGKRVMLTFKSPTEDHPFENVHNLVDHIRYWLNPDVISQGEVLFKSSRKIRLENIPDLSGDTTGKDLDTVLNAVRKTGHDVLVADVTTSDIAQFGLKVVRAIIPGFLPLNKRHDCRPLESKRLRRYLESNQLMDSIQTLPHPFA